MFSALLDEVQRIRRGRWVDTRERLALNRLLLAYEGASLEELRTAVVAVLACTVDEARAIEAAFDALYLAPPKPQAAAPALPARLSIGAWILALLVPVACCSLAFLVSALGSEPRGKPAATPLPPLPTPTAKTVPIIERRYRLPSLRDAAERRLFLPLAPDLYVPAILLGAAALAGLGRRAARSKRRSWNDQRWQDLAKLQGPRDYQANLETERVASLQLQQLARGLELAAGRTQQAGYLDIDATVERTAQTAAISLVYASKPALGRVLVLRDVSPGMLPWRSKIDRFLADVAHQSVVELLYFDRDPSRVCQLPGQVQEPLRNWALQYGGLPLVVVSDGQFFEREQLLHQALRDHFEPWPVRVLLHPLDDGALWPKELTRAEAVLPGFSMTSRGYRSLYRWLPGRAKIGKERLSARYRPLEPSQVLRLRGMLSFLPQPSFELAELLRAQLLPDAPESILLTLEPILGGSATWANDVAEARAWLREWFSRHPVEAQAFANFWDERVSPPPANSAAYQRYLRDRAVMALYLKTDAEAAAAVQELGASPLVEDWIEEVGRIRSRNAGAALRRLATQLKVTSASAARLGNQRPGGWRVPGIGTTLFACFGAALLIPLGELASTPVTVGAKTIEDVSTFEAPLECPKDEVRCGERCVNLQADAANCGTCGTSCANGELCRDRRCGCPEPLMLCGDACVDTRTDRNNCGACGKTCSKACAAGACDVSASGCKDYETLCNGRCVDLRSDWMNCGKCGANCGIPNATRGCGDGKCQVPHCIAGKENCDGLMRNGCEADLRSIDNCGLCGAKCQNWPNRESVCNGKMCLPGKCSAGYGDCDGEWSNGCEAKLNTAQNCGKCGASCGTGSTCGDGACVKNPVARPSEATREKEPPGATTTALPSCDADCTSRYTACEAACRGGPTQAPPEKCIAGCSSSRSSCAKACGATPSGVAAD